MNIFEFWKTYLLKAYKIYKINIFYLKKSFFFCVRNTQHLLFLIYNFRSLAVRKLMVKHFNKLMPQLLYHIFLFAMLMYYIFKYLY